MIEGLIKTIEVFDLAAGILVPAFAVSAYALIAFRSLLR